MALASYSASLIVNRAFPIAETPPRLFGSFVEHLGRAVHGGLFDPGHPAADARGFRRDVLDLVRELAVPLVRYPGGNFVSGYNWEDGVGPREGRPRRLDLAWHATETNAFGTNEFIDWCRAAGAEPCMAVNLGTRGPAEAAALVEYANHPGGTELSDRRRAHGWKDPHGIKLWCLGNEMDGGWQIGAKTPEEYARIAEEAAKVMKWVDPSIELVACGSSASIMPTFPDWERIVLERTYDLVDYISLHAYYGNNKVADPAVFLARPVEMEAYIRAAAATCDHVQAKRRSRKRMMLSFDEWNAWSHKNDNFPPKERWAVAPAQLEERYTMLDALVVAGMQMALLRNCDRVRIGCQAQLVNVIAPIMAGAGGAWRQAIFHPMTAISRYGRGMVLRAECSVPEQEVEGIGRAALCDLLAVANEDGAVSIFAVNRSLDQHALLSPRIEGFGKLRLAAHLLLRHDDLEAANSEEHPDAVAPIEAPIDPAAESVALPPASFSVLRYLPAK